MPNPVVPPSAAIGGPPVPLPHAVRQWKDAAAGWVRVDDPDTAALLAVGQRAAGIPRVVIVGETNRGKSSLLNALIGIPGASPVDAGVATCTYLEFGWSATPVAVGRFGGGMADITFPIEQLAQFATVDGEPDADVPPPRWVEVGLPSDLLRAVELVDTPGVGGLVAAHAELAAEAAAGATALLFVLDASAPFTRGELDFLGLVSDRVDTVHFVITKTDAYRGWREIVRADQELLARHVPRFVDAPFHPVSSRLAEAAAAQQDPAVVATVLERSGVPALRQVLSRDVSARAALLADANAIRTALTVIEGEIEKLAATRRALTAGAAQGEALKARREELLNQRRAGGRSWQVILRSEIQRARVDLTHETAREVREAGQMFRGAIDGADNDELKKLPFHIDAYAQAMTVRAHGRLLEAMNRIVHTVLNQLFTPEELRVLAGNLATRPYERLFVRPPERQSNVDDKIMSLAGAGMGFTLGTMVRVGAGALLPTAFGVVLLPVSLVLGGAVAWYMVRSRRRVSDKMHLKQWLNEVLGEAKAQIDQNVAAQVIEADQQLTLALDDALTRQVAAVDAEIKEVDGALKLDANERAVRLKAGDERRARGQSLLAGGQSLLERIRTAPTGGPVVAGQKLGTPAGRPVGVVATTASGRAIVVPGGLPLLRPGSGPVALRPSRPGRSGPFRRRPRWCRPCRWIRRGRSARCCSSARVTTPMPPRRQRSPPPNPPVLHQSRPTPGPDRARTRPPRPTRTRPPDGRPIPAPRRRARCRRRWSHRLRRSRDRDRPEGTSAGASSGASDPGAQTAAPCLG